MWGKAAHTRDILALSMTVPNLPLAASTGLIEGDCAGQGFSQKSYYYYCIIKREERAQSECGRPLSGRDLFRGGGLTARGAGLALAVVTATQELSSGSLRETCGTLRPRPERPSVLRDM